MFDIEFKGISTNFEVYQIFFLILAVLGIYLIYSVFRMRKKEEISSMIVVEEELAKCRDKKGFIEETATAVLVLGIVALLYGLFGAANSFFSVFGWGYELCGAAVFFLSYGWFYRKLRSAIAKYCR